ncbi:peptide deformylase [Nicoliella lavandulae]|uniref:Peptide deformylase n=1 Tax=Nicoliella lavandulae TaxID=3082954 RepID=A0ABU8SLJ0_9LACO
MFLMKDIVRDGDPVLRQQAKKVEFPLSPEDRKLADDLMEYLVVSQNEELCKKYKLRAGVGLAAPQVGVSKMMASVLVPNEEDPENPIFKDVIINPVIVSNAVQRCALTEGEGCLSVDEDVPGYVPRSARITLKYQDVDGNEHQLRLKNYPAIVCQHEIDHLHGTLFYDHIDKENPYSRSENEIFIS